MSGNIFESPDSRAFSAEEEDQKKAIYERMAPRRRRFIDKIGYENWDPFQAPKDPLDIRTDVTSRTTQELVREFLQNAGPQSHSNDYGRGVLECALGIVNKEEKFRGVFEFCIWYDKLLKSSRLQNPTEQDPV